MFLPETLNECQIVKTSHRRNEVLSLAISILDVKEKARVQW